MVVPGSPAEGGGGSGERDDVDAQINTLVRVGLLERSSPESVRFVANYMVTVIYDMILHSKRQDMHKVRPRSFRSILSYDLCVIAIYLSSWWRPSEATVCAPQGRRP